jgi:uncharacterized protein (TIGR03435 family)
VKLLRTPQGASLEMPDGEISGKLRVSSAGGGDGQPPRLRFEGSAISMKAFAAMLSTGVVDRPVINMTGLTGTYDIAVDISVTDATGVLRTSVNFGPSNRDAAGIGGRAPAEVASEPSGTSIYSSLKKLGLKLEARKAPLPSLVIDHLEKTPARN